MMEFARIITEFAWSDVVPEAAIRAAIAGPDAFVDEACALLERLAEHQPDDDEAQALAVLVLVLGEIGDRRAFGPLMAFLSQRGDGVAEVLGDVIAETLPNVLISLAGHDAERLEHALEDGRIDEFVREAMFRAWTYLAMTGAIARDEARAWLEGFPRRVALRDGDHGWVAWIDAVAALGFEELSPAVEKVFAEGKIVSLPFGGPPIAPEDFRSDLEAVLSGDNVEAWRRERGYHPFEDTIAELSGWYEYSEKYRREHGEVASPPMLDFSQPTFNPNRAVGRNDPCPCGSGKKYKKCCLQ